MRLHLLQIPLRGPTVLATHYELVINTILMMLDEKCVCQKPDTDELGDVDADEHDFVVIDTVGGERYLLLALQHVCSIIKSCSRCFVYAVSL
jgi:hypothetical protein